jgi:hypothetical protein
MSKYGTIEYKILTRITRKKCAVFLRGDFKDLAGYDQAGRILRGLVRKGRIIKIGYGLYAKAQISPFNGQVIPQKNLPHLAKEALERLGLKTDPSSMERDYNAGRSTQVPTGRMIRVRGRISRKIGYNGAYVSYERFAK